MMARAMILSFLLLVCTPIAEADTNKIRMGTDGEYPPFNSVDQNGRLVGFNIDVGNALCAAMQVECEWITSNWDQLIPSLLTNKIDAVVASLSVTSKRREIIAFTDKYYVSPIRFIRAKGSQHTPENISGKMIGVEIGSSSERLLRQKFPNAVVKTYAEQQQANLALASSRVDLVAADAFLLMGFLSSDEGLDAEFIGSNYTDPLYIGEGVAIGLRKEDETLRSMFNQAIKKIRDQGVYQKINSQYFEFDIFGE